MHLAQSEFGGILAMVAAVIVSGFLSEDAATITAATLAASSMLDFRIALASSIAGLWVGDLAVYFAARSARAGAASRGCVSRWLLPGNASAVGHAEASGPWKLAASRF